jgi:hypothetical protein
MIRHRLLPLLLLPLTAVRVSALPGGGGAGNPTPEEGAAVAVVMEDSKASRPAKITNAAGAFKMLVAGPPAEELVKRGTVQVDRRKYTLYLPRAKSYSTKNTGPSDCDNDNTSTLITVDQNGDGRMTENDGWFANLPLRLGDRMFDVAEIAADGSRVVLKPSRSPLRGVIVGRACPPFSFKTADGKEVTRDSLGGKPFLLDIWSFT